MLKINKILRGPFYVTLLTFTTLTYAQSPLIQTVRGRVLDAMLRSATPPIMRGVTRGTHEYFNRIDAERQTEIARTLNSA